MVSDTGSSVLLIHWMLLAPEATASAGAMFFYFIFWFKKERAPVRYTLVDMIGNGVLILLLAVLNTTHLIFWRTWFFQVCDVYFVALRLIVTVARVIVQHSLKKDLTVSVSLVAACFVRAIRFFVCRCGARISYDFFRSGKYGEEGGPLHTVRALVNVRQQQYGSVVFAENKSKTDF